MNTGLAADASGARDTLPRRPLSAIRPTLPCVSARWAPH